MSNGRILVLGGTGMLGRPVVNCLARNGHEVRVLTRSAEKVREAFGKAAEAAVGSVTDRESLRAAMAGCERVHINLPPDSEFTATGHVIELAEGRLERITYISATTLGEENRWFYRVDIKLRTEELLRASGLPHVVFRPTWVMETLPNFIRGGRAVVVLGKSPPALHFFAAADFGRMVAASYDDDRALGKSLYIYGPEAITLADAMERFAAACHPEVRVVRWKLWKARLAAMLLRNRSLAEVNKLIAYLDVAGEHGDPSEANELFGAPTITLEQWCALPRDQGGGWPH